MVCGRQYGDMAQLAAKTVRGSAQLSRGQPPWRDARRPGPASRRFAQSRASSAYAFGADQRGELGPVRHVQRFAADVRARARTCTTSPGRGRPRPSRGDRTPTTSSEDPRAVRAIDPVLRAANRQLPADLGLGLERIAPRAQRERVQRTAGAARESRPVEEDAGAVDDPGAAPVSVLADVVLLHDGQLAALRASLVGQLPVGRGQLLGELAAPASRRPCRRRTRRGCSSRRRRALR